MSGGHFDYKQQSLLDIADEIDKLVNDLDYPPDILVRFLLASATCRKAAKMVHDVDWLVCGDYGEDTFRVEWNKR